MLIWKDSKDTNKIPKEKNVKIGNKKNTPHNTNIASEIQTSDSDQSADTDKNDNDSMDWKNLPNIVIMSEDSDSSNTGGDEWLDDSLCEQNHTISHWEYAKFKLSNFAV